MMLLGMPKKMLSDCVKISDFDTQESALAADCREDLCLTGHSSGKVRLWRVGQIQSKLVLETTDIPVRSLCFSQAGKQCLVGDDKGSIAQWDLNGGRLLQSFSDHTAQVTCLRFLPTRKGFCAASGSDDKSIKVTSTKLWDLRMRRCVRSLKGHRSEVSSIAFSPDCNWLVSGGQDGAVKVWDMRKNCNYQTISATEPVKSVLISQGLPQLTVLHSSGSLRFFNFTTFEQLNCFDGTPTNLGVSANPSQSCVYVISPQNVTAFEAERGRIASVSAKWNNCLSHMTTPSALLVLTKELSLWSLKLSALDPSQNEALLAWERLVRFYQESDDVTHYVRMKIESRALSERSFVSIHDSVAQTDSNYSFEGHHRPFMVIICKRLEAFENLFEVWRSGNFGKVLGMLRRTELVVLCDFLNSIFRGKLDFLTMENFSEVLTFIVKVSKSRSPQALALSSYLANRAMSHLGHLVSNALTSKLLIIPEDRESASQAFVLLQEIIRVNLAKGRSCQDLEDLAYYVESIQTKLM